jgi:hypothetical protein
MDRRYQAHRIIWKWVTGEDPPWEIDHKDQDRANNRWVNLRRATDSEQQWNRGLRKSNTSGWRGVHWQRKWKAAILVNGVRRYLGRFATAEEASAAYEVAARKLHGEFYRPQRR